MSEDRAWIPGWDYAAPVLFRDDGTVLLAEGDSLFVEGRDWPIHVPATRAYTEEDLAALVERDRRENPERWEAACAGP